MKDWQNERTIKKVFNGVGEKQTVFNSLNYLLNTLIVGSLAYIATIIILRLSGKRILSKWNAFDFVITIALGSILATTLLSAKTSLVQGIVAFGILSLSQYIITWIAVRSSIVQKLIKAQPTLLLYQGNFQDTALKHERVSEGEILSALRSKGIAAIETVEAVVLETDGSFSVIKQIDNGFDSALKDVKGYNTKLNN